MIICTRRNEEAGASRAPAKARSRKEGVMLPTIDCCIISRKSQNDPGELIESVSARCGHGYTWLFLFKVYPTRGRGKNNVTGNPSQGEIGEIAA